MAKKQIDAAVARISDRIRRWREEQGMTRQELGERSGLAISTVHKVETGQMIPSVAVLLKLAHGLGRRPTDILADAEYEEPVALMRAKDRETFGLEDRIRVERLSGEIVDPILEMWRVVLNPGMSSGRKPIRNDGDALIICEKGRLSVTLGEEEHLLGPGDTLHFKASIPHSWRNRTRSVVRFTITGTLSKEIRAFLHQRVAQAGSPS
jgi:transcriptional regulator with XRE-family HTH domain